MRGDIVLCRATDYGRGNWYDRLIAWATHGPFVHVEVDIGDSRFIGAHLSGISEIGAGTGPDYIYCSPQATDEDISAAIAWLRKQVGKRYGWLDIISAGLKFLGLPWFIGVPGHYDCSDLVTRYLLIARDKRIIPNLSDLSDEPHLVSPNDLARAYGLIDIHGKEIPQ